MEVPTLKDLLEQNAEKYRNQIAFQIRQDSGYRQLTFQQVQEKAKQVQAALVGLGVRPGDRVALISESRPEWPISYLAIVGLGAVVVPLDAMLSKEEILPLISDSSAKVIILSEKFGDYVIGTNLEKHQLVMENFKSLPLPSCLLPMPLYWAALAASC